MPLKLTTEAFASKAFAANGDKYSYKKVTYINSKTPVCITCNSCGNDFWQIPNSHLNGHGCPQCAVLERAQKRNMGLGRFIEKAMAVHGNGRYTYDQTVYVNSKTAVVIKCAICKLSFSQVPSDHLSGRGCPNCGGKLRSNSAEFAEKAKAVHGNLYVYDRANYVSATEEIEIGCVRCGNYFWQKPYSHLDGKGCKTCGIAARASKRKWTQAEFITRCKAAHADKYGYDRAKYISADKKVEIFCRSCDSYFSQRVFDHLYGAGCPLCADASVGKKKRLGRDEFIRKAMESHGDLYTYQRIIYTGNKIAVEIGCTVCGNYFWQRPDSHLNGNGCPRCKMSTGEQMIELFLASSNLSFTREKRFKDCVYKAQLPFDFYLPSSNTCIEFQGKQHYEPIGYFGGQLALDALRQRDQVKSDYCKAKGIRLIEIRYDCESIIDYLSKQLGISKQ